MKVSFFILIIACSALAITAQARKVFPYQYQVNDLPNGLRVVMITKDSDGLRDGIVKNKPAKINYAAPKPKEITDEDKIIETYPIRVKADDVTITPVEKVFE